MSRHVILGVGGGISAYKACELLRRLSEAGCEVRVIPTHDALRFVGEPTWAALSGRPATADMWSDVHEVPHVRLGQWADLVFVAPATADLLARAAAGRSDDLLTATLLTARCPVVFAPAMHTEMWQHPATQANAALLRDRGALVVEPATGRLTGPDTGPGRLPEPAELAEVAFRVLDRGAGALRPDLAGRRVVVSAGGTREELDPVRFLGNWSSGLQGYALARTAVARGAEVTLVSANVALDDPAGAKIVRVVSATQLGEAMTAAAAGADAVVMAAAVADFRPAARQASKIKKAGAVPEPITLAENPDVLAGLCAHRGHPGQVVVGFGAETEDLLANGRAKLARKGCDLLVVNQVGGGLAFGTIDNEAVVLGADGSVTEVPRGRKTALADAIWDLVAARLP
ncbi:MAG TPA: bifunctional phosphopantothenoylcysteine decarboxylase/phosphopantothenate--cysteine ligase CoaBC [Streptosporangiaceae bacterium]|jgi:phosphopantothenoylcysteine decarboxylase/phosphopantothenate--cysteine ligase|nr:bifunctional phosphopantothenoylcysteine decarboxylase/phosphopantothenate--cysteine ligase CoaBC [Streptosporangiaceae bacterium]